MFSDPRVAMKKDKRNIRYQSYWTNSNNDQHNHFRHFYTKKYTWAWYMTRPKFILVTYKKKEPNAVPFENKKDFD